MERNVMSIDSASHEYIPELFESISLIASEIKSFTFDASTSLP